MMKPARNLSLDEWLADIKAHAIAMAARPSVDLGACLVPNPQTGENDCVRTDKDTCAKIGGVFIGGPCGPIGAIPPEEA